MNWEYWLPYGFDKLMNVGVNIASVLILFYGFKIGSRVQKIKQLTDSVMAMIHHLTLKGTDK